MRGDWMKEKANNDAKSDKLINPEKSVFQNLREENEKRQKQLEQQQEELQKQVELREKQRREAYEKRIQQERLELMRMKQGLIEESSLIPEEEEEEEIKMSLWARFRSFIYLNKWWLGLACFVVFLGVFLIRDYMSRPRPDMVVLLIGKYGAIGESENLSEYVKSFADDFNGNGKTEVEVYYIDYDSKEDYANYANGSDTKLTTEMQIADAVMVISDHDFSGMVVPDEVFVDLSSLFPDNEHIDKQFFYLKDTDFADRVGVDRSKIKDDTFIAVRAPKRVMYASKDEMQETYNKDMPVIEKIIDDLSK